jgi:hypothetical protein
MRPKSIPVVALGDVFPLERGDSAFECAHRVGVERWPEADPLDINRAKLGNGPHFVGE